MVPFSVSQGFILAQKIRFDCTRTMPRSDLLEGLEGGGCVVILVKKYLSYAWSIKEIFVNFAKVDSSLISLLLLYNFMCKLPFSSELHEILPYLLQPLMWKCKKYLPRLVFCRDLQSAWLYLFWSMNDIYVNLSFLVSFILIFWSACDC